MNIVGWVLLAFGLVLLIVGFLQMSKKKKMETVPYRKPSEIVTMGATAADAKGLVSSEGQVQPGPLQLTAPMSGQPCLAYEIIVERKWEKHVMTEKGQEKKTGSDKVFSENKGAVFHLSDGTGQVVIDATQELDADMDKSHSSTVTCSMVIPGTLHFGSLQMNTPHIHGNETRTTSFVGTEKILKPSPTLYALGALSQGQYGLSIHTPKGVGTGKLILSHQGREKLLSKTKRNMILGYAFGGILFLGGGGLGLFGPKATGGGGGCGSKLTGVVSCEDHMSSDSGLDYDWTVSDAGNYQVMATHPALAFPVYPVLELRDSSGTLLGKDVSNSDTQPARVVQALKPGTYKIHIGDRDNATSKISGGFTVRVSAQKTTGDAPASTGVATNTPASTTAPAAPTHAGTAAHPAATVAPKKK